MENNSVNVLIVEDNPGDLRLVAEMLRESASPVFKAAHAGRLGDALKRLEDEKFDVVLLDMDLPDSTGLEGLKKLSVRNLAVPFIVLTGRADDTLGLEALQKGAEDYLTKGHIDANLLSRAIRYAIERRRALTESRITAEFLRLVNENSGMRPIVRAATAFFQQQSGCQAVGIRLKEELDYPYFESRGFPAEFIKAENSLCAKDRRGRPLLDAGCNPVLDCMCGNVICGRFDPSKAFFTKRGSFWSNCTTELLAATTEADRQARTRNRCNGEGYESVALIALRAGRETLGLLQLNDKRKDVFSPGTISLWERLADKLAAGLAKARAEEALAESEKRYRLISENTGDVIWTMDAHTLRFTYVSPSVFRMRGYTPQEVMDRPLEDALTPESYRRVTLEIPERLKSFIAGEESSKLLTEQIDQPCKDGSVLSAEVLTTILPDAEGRPAAILGVTRDITGRKRAEEALRESEVRFRTIAENLPVLISITRTEDSTIVFTNTAYNEAFGFRKDELLGRQGPDVYYDPADRVKLLGEIKKRGSVNNYQLRAKRSDGKTLWLLSSVQPILFDGKPAIMGASVDISEYKRAEEALRESEERYAAIHDNATFAISLTKMPEGTFTSVNDAFLRLFKCKREEVIGKNSLDLNISDPDSRARLAAELEKRGYVRDFECTRQAKDGTSVNLLVNLNHVIIGGRKYVLATRQDITERVKAEEERDELLAEVKRRALELDTVFKTLPYCVSLHGPDGKYLRVNPALVDLFGVDPVRKPREEIAARLKARYPDGRPFTPENMPSTRALNGETVTDEEYLITDAKGKDRTLLFNAVPLKVAGHVYGAVLAQSDITERKNREAELQKLNRALKAHSDSSQSMMRATGETDYIEQVCRNIVKDCGHSMVWVGLAENDEARTVRPVAQAGFEEGYLETLRVTWADTERGRGPTGTAIRTGKPSGCRNMLTDPAFEPWRDQALKRGYASSLVLPLKSGRKTFGALTIYSREPYAFMDSETELLCEIADDLAFGITALRLRREHEKAEEILRRDNETFEKEVKARSQELLDAHQELERAKRLSDIGTLAATVAHELRNPLAAITMAASNIERKAANPLLDKHFRNIEKKVSESNTIINNLLFYSRLRTPQYETVDIRAILEECAGAARAAAGCKAEVRLELDPLKNTRLQADPLQLKELFSNIINNACDALSALPGGTVRVRAGGNAAFVRINIEDTGPGIPRENLGRIFEPFFSTKAKGTGLGLSVCSQIADLHGGAITVASEPGSTVFKVDLPRDPAKWQRKKY